MSSTQRRVSESEALPEPLPLVVEDNKRGGSDVRSGSSSAQQRWLYGHHSLARGLALSRALRVRPSVAGGCTLQPSERSHATMLTTILLLVAQRPDDEVKQFPGFSGKMPSKVFSGYLKASAEGQTFYSHYVLTESRHLAGFRSTGPLAARRPWLVGIRIWLSR